MNIRSVIVHIWIFAVLLSFGYELPVFYISSVDRFNPRLFDILFIIGVILFNTRIFQPCDNWVLSLWGKCILWMSLCVVATVLLTPRLYGLYSLYYLFRYVQGYIVIKLLLLNRECLNIGRLEIIFIVVGLIVSYFSILQYYGVLQIELDSSLLEQGDPISERIMIGPYGSTYFALAQIIPICLLFCLNRVIRLAKFRVLFLIIALLFLYVGTNCGSRIALVLTLGCLVLYLLVGLGKRGLVIGGIIVSLCIVFLYTTPGKIDELRNILFENNTTLARGSILEEEKETSVETRVGAYHTFKISDYDYGLMMPFLGSGFYVSPKKGQFRVGYGFHNNYIFAFEQMGIMGLLLFIWLLFRVLKGSFRVRHENDVGKMMFVFTLVLCLANFGGQVFWQGFGTCDINTLIVFLMTLSIEPNINYV